MLSARDSTGRAAGGTRPAVSSYISVVGEITNKEAWLLDDIYRALGDPTRREVLQLLKARDMTAGEIADRFPLAKSTLSGHFAVLKQAGLIVAERQGTRLVYSLNLSVFEEALSASLDLFRVGKDGRKKR